mgnify:CR=1 FL=1
MLRNTKLLALCCLVWACSETVTESEPGPCNGDECADMGLSTQDAAGEVDAESAPDQGVGEAEVTPGRFEFAFVAPGDSLESVVRISNAGTGPLVLSQFAAAFSSEYTLYMHEGAVAAPLTEQDLVVRGGQSTFPETLEIAPDSVARFTLVYTPTEGGQRGGHLSISGDREIRIPIGHSDDRPEFSYEPEIVDFGAVAPGERQLGNLQVTNIGSAIATLESVTITGDQAFSISIEGRDPQVDSRALHNPDRDLEPGVGLEKYFDVLIRCQPETDEPIEAMIHIVSDASNDSFSVPVRANFPDPKEAP